MRMTPLLIVTIALSGLPRAAAADPIFHLVAQMGSQKYAEREAATRALDELGVTALPALRKALQADDLEVRRRAEALVQRIERRLEVERLLEPKRVRLAFQDVPVSEAVLEIKRQTGYDVQLGGDLTRLAQRRITLDTGPCTFWEALGRFCAQAGLKENQTPSASFQQERFSVVQNGGVVNRIVTRHAYAGSFERGLTLFDGPPQPVPTHQAGAIRFRALPARGTPSAGMGLGNQGFFLEIMPEPKLAWLGVVETRIERAVDDQGQVRSATTAAAAPSLEAEIRWLIETDLSRPAASSQVPVQLLPGEKPARRLREVKGQVTAQVQTPLETVLEIGNILDAAGQSYAAGEDNRVKVLEVTNPPRGLIRIRLQLEGPANAMAVWNAAAGVRANRRALSNPYTNPNAGAIWTLFDEQGRSFRRVGFEPGISTNANGTTQEVRLTFQPDPSLGQPTRLVETGRRTVLLDVPFVLQDVPLP